MSGFCFGLCGEWRLMLSLLGEQLIPALLPMTIGILMGVCGGLIFSPSALWRKTFIRLDRLTFSLPMIAVIGAFYSTGSGYGAMMTAVFIVYSFIPLLRRSYEGIRAADNTAIEACRAMGWSEWGVFLYLKLPAFLPYFMKGLRKCFILIIGASALIALVRPAGLGDLLVRMKEVGPTAAAEASLTLILAVLAVDAMMAFILVVLKRRGLTTETPEL